MSFNVSIDELTLNENRQTKNMTIFLFRNAPIAQSVEQWSYKPYVAGSSPAGSIRVIFTGDRLLLKIDFNVKICSSPRSRNSVNVMT